MRRTERMQVSFHANPRNPLCICGCRTLADAAAVDATFTSVHMQTFRVCARLISTTAFNLVERFVDVAWAGRASCATSAYRILAASTDPAANRGSAAARTDGEASSVLKVGFSAINDSTVLTMSDDRGPSSAFSFERRQLGLLLDCCREYFKRSFSVIVSGQI